MFFLAAFLLLKLLKKIFLEIDFYLKIHFFDTFWSIFSKKIRSKRKFVPR